MRREKTGEAAARTGRLEQAEVDLYTEFCSDGLIAGADYRFEAPLAHRPYHAFVEAHSDPTDHAHIGDRAVGENSDFRDDGALVAGLPGLFRIGRLRAVEAHRIANAVRSHAEVAAANPASLTRANAWPPAAANAPAGPCPDAATRARAVGIRNHRGQRVAVIGQIGLWDFDFRG